MESIEKPPPADTFHALDKTPLERIVLRVVCNQKWITADYFKDTLGPERACFILEQLEERRLVYRDPHSRGGTLASVVWRPAHITVSREAEHLERLRKVRAKKAKRSRSKLKKALSHTLPARRSASCRQPEEAGTEEGVPIEAFPERF